MRVANAAVEGYWPESLLTPPDSEAISRDLEMIKAQIHSSLPLKSRQQLVFERSHSKGHNRHVTLLTLRQQASTRFGCTLWSWGKLSTMSATSSACSYGRCL